MTRTVLGIIALVAILLCSCADNRIADGGGIGTGNPAIQGRLTSIDGAPATGVYVALRPTDYLPKASAKVFGSFSLKTLDSTFTDSLGNFALDSIAPGTYMLECLDGEDGNGALIDSVVVSDSDMIIQLATDTLKPLGKIMGQVQVPEGLRASQVRVFVYGLGRIAEPDSLGRYEIPNLAMGEYSLRIQAGADRAIDLQNVSVPAGDVAWAPSISLPGAHKAYASKTTGTVILDGLLNEADWSGARTIQFSNPAASENQVTIRILWDSTSLYVAYEVKDSHVGINPDTIEASQDDCAEFYIDPDHDESSAMDADDLQFFFNVVDESEIFRQDQRIAPAISGKSYRTPLGYNLEMAVPWILIGVPPSEGLMMGALFVNNDKDGPVRDQLDWLGLASAGIIYKRPNYWGDLILLP